MDSTVRETCRPVDQPASHAVDAVRATSDWGRHDLDVKWDRDFRQQNWCEEFV